MPGAHHAGGLVIHRKETLDAKFLQRDVLGNPQRRDGREQAQLDLAFAEIANSAGVA
jgi:hypothetical protein